MTLLCLLAAADYHYVPFYKALPLWDAWYLLALPLCLGIAIVYKSIRCDSMRKVPVQALELFLFIVLGLIGCMLGLAVLVNLVSH